LIHELYLWDEDQDEIAETLLEDTSWTYAANGGLEHYVMTDVVQRMDCTVENNPHGLWTDYECIYDYHRDDASRDVRVGQCRYDRWGHCIEQISEYDALGDGIVDSGTIVRRTFEGGPGARELESVTEWDHDGDGNPDRITTTRHSYDGERLIEEAVEEDHDGDGILDRVVTVTHTHDEEGRVIRSTEETDRDGDGILDRVEETYRSYDDRGRTVLRTETTDSGADGTVDYLTEESWSYDGRGNIVEEGYKWDYRADGVYELRRTVTRTFDSRDRVTHEATVRHSHGRLSSMTSTAFEYDALGNLLTESLVDGLSGIQIRTTTHTY
jgi:hypothetical protein